MYDIVFYEIFQEERRAIKKFLPPTIKAKFVESTLLEDHVGMPTAKIVSTRTHSRIPLLWARQVQGILTRSQGFDHLKEYCHRTGFSFKKCGYLPHYCDRAVAEQAVLLMMSLLRRLGKQVKHFESFNRNNLCGQECLNKNTLVIGVGHIGKEIVRLCKGLDMNVRGVDLVRREKKLAYVSLRKGIGWADVVFCALPLTDQTRDLLCYKLLKNARQGFSLINISRGEITPLKDIQRLLKEGVLGGIGLDVYPNEDDLSIFLKSQNKKGASLGAKIIASLKGREDAVLTPHNAFNTNEALERKAKYSVDAIKFFLRKGEFPCFVK